MALAVACASNEPTDPMSPDGNDAGQSTGGQSIQGHGGVSGPLGGSKASAGRAGSSASAGRQTGAAGTDVEGAVGGSSGVTAAAGAGGEIEPSVLPGGCTGSTGELSGEAGAAAGLVVKLKANSDRAEEFPHGEVQVSNESSAGIALESLELRYYIESEYSPEQTDELQVVVDHAQKSGRVYANIAHQLVLTDLVPLEPYVSGADAFIRIGFLGGAGQEGMLLPGETVLVQFRIQPPDDSYYRVPRDQTNDYSFGACPRYAATWSRIVLISEGELVSGEPPPGLPTLGEGGAGGQGGASNEAEQAGAGVGGKDL